MSDSNIHSRALLVSLSISTWTARKFDKKVTHEVNKQYNAPEDAGRWNKHLLAGAGKGSYNRLMSMAQQIRLEHYSRTLPWTDEGWRILSTPQYMEYMDWYRKRRADFLKAKTDFSADFPVLRQQLSSNPMFNSADYPAVKDIESKFDIRVDFSPIAMNSDIRVNLAADQIAELEKNVTDRVTLGLQTATLDAWHRLHKVTNHIATQCGDPDARLYKTMIENTKDLCQILVSLNVANDPQLEQMRKEVETQLASQDVEDLRANPGIRASVADKANEILEKMKQIGYGPKA